MSDDPSDTEAATDAGATDDASDQDSGTDVDTDADTDEPRTPTIRELDDRTVRQIAAGEVVERPASVVKELLENSLDADASRISVAVDAGGTEGIRVRDDGVGMRRASVERAVEEHTTSKIDDIEDLEAGVGTLGFRGEALHTIGAVSRLTIRTKPRGGDAGTELRVEGGEVTEVAPAGARSSGGSTTPRARTRSPTSSRGAPGFAWPKRASCRAWNRSATTSSAVRSTWSGTGTVNS